MTVLTNPPNRSRLLQAVEQLNTEELTRFVNDVLAVRARRVAPVLSTSEEGLLTHVAHLQLTVEEKERLHALQHRSETETISDRQRQELIALAERSERLNAERIAVVVQLAALREQPFRTVMDELGLLNIHAHSE